MAHGALKVLQSKNTSNGLVELCEYPEGLFHERYGVQVNDKEVEVGFLSYTTNDLQKAEAVYDSY